MKYLQKYVVYWTCRGGYGERSGYTTVNATDKRDARRVFMSDGYMPLRPDEKMKVERVEDRGYLQVK